MRSELIVALGVFFSCLGVYSASRMFPDRNRPRIFRGKWGEAFFALIHLSILVGMISLLVWSFLNVTWYVNVLTLMGMFVVSTFIIQALPAIFITPSFAPIAAAGGLLVLHNVAWFSTRIMESESNIDAWFVGLCIIQTMNLLIYRWAGKAFVSQPRQNHPAIFWNPISRSFLVVGPVVMLVLLIVLAFFVTDSHWWFLGFSVFGFFLFSPRPSFDLLR